MKECFDFEKFFDFFFGGNDEERERRKERMTTSALFKNLVILTPQISPPPLGPFPAPKYNTRGVLYWGGVNGRQMGDIVFGVYVCLYVYRGARTFQSGEAKNKCIETDATWDGKGRTSPNA